MTDFDDEGIPLDLKVDSRAWMVVGALTSAFPQICPSHKKFVSDKDNYDDGLSSLYSWSSWVMSDLLDEILAEGVDAPTKDRFWKIVEVLLAFGDIDIRNWVFCEIVEHPALCRREFDHIGPLGMVLVEEGKSYRVF